MKGNGRMFVVLLSAALPMTGWPEGAPQVLAPGEVHADVRLGPLKDLDGHFPFEVPASAAEWKQRSREVRERVLVSQGLWPLPERTPLRPVIRDTIEFGDYSVEKVHFESLPGFHVTGNLYRPQGRQGPFPGVLCPHGHWSQGRFTDDANIRRAIASGAERFERGGRSPLQARCVQLARMGCVVLHYDMIGYADSTQISYQLAHRFARQRPEMNRGRDWGLFSPRAESHLQSVMGLQTWNSIRALDFLETLPEVDRDRLAVTGASGGGTQTFMLAAIDPRPACAFPAVMVSTAMQGGCTCENASLLRIGTGNVELSSLFAPRPLGLTGADDWTVDMATDGFPQLQALYRLLGAGDRVMLRALNHFGHNYNAVSRTAMYHWFNRHLGLGMEEPILERDHALLSREEMSVWDDRHPRPEGGDDFERGLLRHWHEDSLRQLEAWRESPEDFAGEVAPALRVVVGRTLESAGRVELDLRHKEDRGGWLEMAGLLRNITHGETVPALFLHPHVRNGDTVIWPLPGGKAGLYSGEGRPSEEVARLLEAGVTVVGPDLLFQGEAGGTVEETRKVDNPREAAAYTFGYNHALFAQRVHDLLTCIRFVRDHHERSRRIVLVGISGAGPWAVVARSVSGTELDACAIDTGGFRFADVADLRDPSFLPGGAKYLDLPGFLLAGEAGPLWIAGEEGKTREWLLERYAVDPEPLAFGARNDPEAVVDWILR